MFPAYMHRLILYYCCLSVRAWICWPSSSSSHISRLKTVSTVVVRDLAERWSHKRRAPISQIQISNKSSQLMGSPLRRMGKIHKDVDSYIC